jgi:hypothetical protein
LLRDELNDESVIEAIQSLDHLINDDTENISGVKKLFYLVYCHIPRRMKTKLRSLDGKDVTMTEYFEHFPVTVEALILMMFQTVPDYLKGQKFNTNRAIKEERCTSTNSSESTVTSESKKKKGGRPADKTGFVLDIFQDYLDRAANRREFHFPRMRNNMRVKSRLITLTRLTGMHEKQTWNLNMMSNCTIWLLRLSTIKTVNQGQK